MKKGLVFFLGMIAGVVLTFIVLFIISMAAGSNSEVGSTNYRDPGISMFSETGETMPFKAFKVFQVLPNGTALAMGSEKADAQYVYDFGDTVILLLPDENNSYYDNQIVKIPANKVARQAGTYRYENKEKDVKTVPIISFTDK